MNDDDIVFSFANNEMKNANFLEQCFGGYAISVNMDEDGNIEEVCGCRGDECSKYC